VWPEDDRWTTATPESQGMSTQLLRDAPGKMETAIDNAIVIRHGYDVWHFGGDPYSNNNGWWASVMRSFHTSVWGMLLQKGDLSGGQSVVDGPVNQLPSDKAKSFGDDTKVKHLLSYTACASPPGSGWQYACMYNTTQDIFFELAGEKTWDYINNHLFPILGGNTWEAVSYGEGDYLRIVGPEADLARWGYLFLRKGKWKDQQVLDPWFVEMATSPINNPNGSGYANINEGWQIHLNTDGNMWPGLPKDSYAALGAAPVKYVVWVCPSLDMVVARNSDWSTPSRSFPGGLEEFLLPIVEAVIDSTPVSLFTSKPRDIYMSQLHNIRSLNLFNINGRFVRTSASTHLRDTGIKIGSRYSLGVNDSGSKSVTLISNPNDNSSLNYMGN